MSATYTDPDNRDEISVHLKTTEDLVEIPGDVTIEGASANFVYYDVDTFWYALSPDEGADEIVFRGTLKCTTEEILFIVVLTLSPDSDDIDYRIEFPEPDAGSGAADAGE